MKTSLTKFTALLATCLFTALALPLHAGVYAIVTNATPYTALDGLIAPNLIRTGQSSLASVVYSGPAQSGFTVAGLNDGSAAANANMTYLNGSFPIQVTFNLNTNNGTGGSTNGYDISAVQCLAGWAGNDFANQNFQVLLSINGGAFSAAYGNYVGTSTLGSGNNCVMTTITNSSGPIARNVTAIEYIFSTPASPSSGNGSQMVIHELQAFGTPSLTGAAPVPATVITVTNGATYNACDGFIVTNLLQAGQSSISNVVVSHSPSGGWYNTGLNDGVGNATLNGQAGLVYYPAPGGAGGAGGLPVTITFNLNTNNATGGATNGYNINAVQAIAGWNNSYFANLNFQLLFSINGGPFYDYGSFVTVNTLNGGNNSTMATVTNLAGAIATNVTAIQLVFKASATGGQPGIVLHELQAFGTPSVAAAPVPTIYTTQLSSNVQSTYDGSIAANLIQNGQQTLGSVYANGSPSTALGPTSGLNDGSAAANANLTYYGGGDGVLPSTVTYYLNTNSGTGSPNGYNITNVQALSGWTDSYFADQKFQLLFSINGGAFQDYGTYSSYNNTDGNSGVSTLETVGRSSGLLATNVTAVQFVLQNPGGDNLNSANTYGGSVYRELQVFGSPVVAVVPAPYLLTDTLPFTAANTVGDSVTFTAAFTNGAAINYQWQFVSSGVTNNLANATNATLTLNNLQLTNSGSYLLEAINATNSAGVTFSTPRPLTVSSVPAAVNNVIISPAAQTGFGPVDTVGISFTPTWTVTTNSSIIAGKFPSVTNGNFSADIAGRNVGSLTAGGNGTVALNSVGTSTNYVTCGNNYGAGSMVIYSLTNGTHGYNLTNLTVYGGWADAGRDQQAYTVYYSTVAAPTTFIPLGSVNYNPTDTANFESVTRVTLTPASGALATNVAAVGFDFTSPASENGYVGYSQITLFGSFYNHAPVAQALTAYLTENKSVTIPVINGPNAPADADGDALTVTSVGTPANGTASTDGTNITYTPAGGFVGTNTFNYTVADGFGGSNTTTVTAVVYPWGVNPTSYGYGFVTTGTLAQATFTLTNGSGSILSGTASVGTAAYSIISGSPFSVAAGGTSTVTVQFAPSLATNYSDTVQFTSGSQIVNVPLTGTGMTLPVANFTGTPTVGLAPLPVTFTDASSGSISNWFWDFGDGTTTNTSSGTAQHTYTKTGQWTVTLIASNPLGTSTNTKPAYIGTTPVVRILPVGDSITDGYSNPAYVPGGYRTLLASLMNAFNYNVISTGLLNMNSPFDTSVWQEGHDGANITGVNYCMQGVFNSTADPDIILLLIGTNDYGQGIGANATNRLDLMISNLATNRPNAKIIVADVLLRTDNLTDNTEITNQFNPFIPGIVAAHAALGQQVYFTDLRSAVTTAGLSPDGLHPNAFGYACMATNWFNTITNVMGVFGSTNAPVISHVVSSGGLTNIVVTFSKPVAASAANVANYTLNGGATVTAATLDAATERVVTLTTSPLTQNAGYTLTVSNVVDLTSAQTPIAVGTTATFNACGAHGATNNVAEATHFQLAYSLNIPNVPIYSNSVTYTVDNHASLGAFGRVAYYLELQATNGGALQYMWVSMNPFTTNLTKIGVPTVASGAVFQQPVTNMNVASSVAGIVTGTNLAGGNLQFWPSNYTADPSTGVYDWSNTISAGNYGAMQIANPNASQMLLSFNAWGGTTVAAADVGIGNNTVYHTGAAAAIDAQTDIQLDWTFSANAAGYVAKTLQVFIQPVPVPGTTNVIAVRGSATILATSNLVALAGNPANYPLTVTAVSATSTNGSSVSLSGGNITYTPNLVGSDSFTYTLSDGNGGTATGTVMLTVQAITSVVLASGVNPSAYGGNVTFTATVKTNSVTAGAVTGSLVFRVDGTAVATNAVASGAGSYTYTVPTAGTHTIAASYSGDVNNLPSTNSLTQTVNQAGLTITANATNKVYNGTAFSGGNGLTYAGFVNSETPAVLGGTLTYTGNSQGAIFVGSYAIMPSGLTSANYNISYVSGTLTVGAKGLTIAASGTSKPYGQNLNLTGFTTAGLTNGDTVSSVTLTSTGATNTATIGGYTIVVTNAMGSGLTNYSISYVAGSLTVTPLAVSLVGTRAYDGTTNAAGANLAVTNVVNSDVMTLTGTGGLASANVGTNAITSFGSLSLSGGAGTNYTLAGASGAMLITNTPLTITANDDSQTYSGIGYSGGNGVTYAGFVNGETNTALTGGLTYGGLAQGAITVGTYNITPGGYSSTNYLINYVDGTLTINPLAVTVTANPQTKVYGSADPALTYGFSPALVVGDSFTGGLSRVAGESVGSFAINQSTLGLSTNYSLTYVGTNLVITAANLTVTANSTSKTYGQTVTFAGTEFTASGLTNGDTVTGVMLTSGGATNTATVGSYSINATSATGSGLGNYSISYVAGSLTVSPLVAALSGTRAYDGTTNAAGANLTVTNVVNSDVVSLTGTGGLAGADAGTNAITTIGSLSLDNGAGTNYTLAGAAGAMIITNTPLVIMANDDSQIYSGVPYSSGNGVTYAGFVNGETNTALAGSLSYSGLAIGATTVGTYNITPGGYSSADYLISYVDGTLTISQSTSVIGTAPTAGAIVYGQTLGDSALSGGLATPSGGSFAFTAPATVPPLGTAAYSVTYTPADPTNYTVATTTVSVTVNPACTAPTIIGGISPTNVTATVGDQVVLTVTNVAGTAALAYQWESNSVAITGATYGSYTNLSVTVADAGNYQVIVTNDCGSITSSVAVLTVNAQTPLLASAPVATTTINYGQPLSAAGLTGGSVTNAAGATVPGSFAYTSPGTTPNAGTLSEGVTFTPADTNNYNNVTTSVSVTVNPALPVVSWGNPADITYGTALSGTQLDATSGGVAGSFAYTPTNGTVLAGGSGQTLSVQFTPTDGVNYSTPAVATVTINVLLANQTITFGALGVKTVGDAPFTLGATASSGLTVSYASSVPTVANVSGNTVTILTAGSTILTASQGGNGNYNAATAVPQPLTVNALPVLGLHVSGTNVILSWPTNTETGFGLESATNLKTPTWVSAGTPTVSGGQNVVTNAIVPNASFYHLKK